MTDSLSPAPLLKLLRTLSYALLALPATAFGTTQVPETLVWQGQELALAATPLKQLDLESPPDEALFSSACWRGYRGRWEMTEDRLYLMELLACHGDRSVWHEFLPNEEPPLPADWYSGILRIPQGKLLQYVHMGFASVHEEDLYLVLVEGVLVGSFKVENDTNSLSYQDRQRAELGKPDAVDGVCLPENEEHMVDGDWLDAMLLRQSMGTLRDSSATAVAVRGLYFPGRLYLPGNGAAPALELWGRLDENVREPEIASAVEAQISLSPSEGFLFHSLRPLEEGAFIDRRGRVKVNRLGDQ